MAEDLEKIEKKRDPRGRKPGTRKTGGRKAGSVNKATVDGYAHQVAERVACTVERVLREYSEIAFLDIRQAFDAEGNLKPIQDFPESLARAISGIETEERFTLGVHTGRIHKIRVTNKLGALDSIAKHLGMFVERHRFVDQNGKDRPFLLSDADRLVAEADAADAAG